MLCRAPQREVHFMFCGSALMKESSAEVFYSISFFLNVNCMLVLDESIDYLPVVVRIAMKYVVASSNGCKSSLITSDMMSISMSK